MKPRKVKGAQLHIGVRVGGETRTSLDAEQQKIEIILEESGLYVGVKSPFVPIFVPFSNIVQIFMYNEESIAEVKKKVNLL